MVYHSGFGLVLVDSIEPLDDHPGLAGLLLVDSIEPNDFH